MVTHEIRFTGFSSMSAASAKQNFSLRLPFVARVAWERLNQFHERCPMALAEQRLNGRIALVAFLNCCAQDAAPLADGRVRVVGAIEVEMLKFLRREFAAFDPLGFELRGVAVIIEELHDLGKATAATDRQLRRPTAEAARCPRAARCGGGRDLWSCASRRAAFEPRRQRQWTTQSARKETACTPA